jgi:hypothetical protein
MLLRDGILISILYYDHGIVVGPQGLSSADAELNSRRGGTSLSHCVAVIRTSFGCVMKRLAFCPFKPPLSNDRALDRGRMTCVGLQIAIDRSKFLSASEEPNANQCMIHVSQTTGNSQ